MSFVNKISISLLLSVAVVFSSCHKSEFSETKSGLKYCIREATGGQKPKISDVMQMHLIYKNQKDSILYDSKSMGPDFMIELTTPSFEGGIEEGFAMMGEGDSASFQIPADSIYTKLFKQTRPSYIKADEMLHFEVRMISIMSAASFKELLQTRKKEAAGNEKEQIKQYLEDNNLPPNPAQEGVYYIPFKAGTGKQPQKGDLVEVKVTGHLLSGQLFESTEKNGKNLIYHIGDGSQPAAFDNAIGSMKEGGLSRLILSSEYGKAYQQQGAVPENAPLVFDLELVKVTSK
jgi:FKBP-type peptidyl-prolyl cis-trans isomerase